MDEKCMCAPLEQLVSLIIMIIVVGDGVEDVCLIAYKTLESKRTSLARFIFFSHPRLIAETLATLSSNDPFPI